MAHIEAKIIVSYFLKLFKVLPNSNHNFGIKNGFVYGPVD